MFASDFFGGKLASDAGDVFFADGAVDELIRHFLGGFLVLADEHDAAR